MNLILLSMLEAVGFVCAYLVVRDRFDPIQGDVYIFAAICVPAMFGAFLLINGFSTTRFGKSFDKRIETFFARATVIMLRSFNARASVVILVILGVGCISATVFFLARFR